MQFQADYYDGISPRAKRVLVTIQEPYFLFQSDEHTQHRYLINNCHIQAKLGNGKRLIDLPDTSRLETDFQQLERYLPKKTSHTFWQVLHYAENHIGIIIISIISLIGVSWSFMVYGIPIIAYHVANATPFSVEKQLGKYTLDTLEHPELGYFTATTLTAERQTALKNRLEQFCKKINDCPEHQLNFRKSPKIGANAFALPGGDIIMTDELVALSEADDEIIAVLAHELGHVKHRDALRHTLESSLSGLLILSITGDASSLAANLPILVINSHYSRAFETEADQYALQTLKTACIPTSSFAKILLKLEKHLKKDSIAIPEIIASHPDTKQRVIAFLKEQPSNCHNETHNEHSSVSSISE